MAPNAAEPRIAGGGAAKAASRSAPRVMTPAVLAARLQWGAAVFLSLGALALSFYGLSWAARLQGALPLKPGTDLLLENLPWLDATPFLSYGFVGLHAVFFLFWLKREPRRVPYLLAQLALFMAVRDVFIALTPVAAPVGTLPIYGGGPMGGFDNTMIFENELFFSGHAGTPFLYFLMSRRAPWLAWTCLVLSGLMGAGVLLTRNHYAIDVLGAWFVTYAVHSLGRKLLGKLDFKP